ncbi:hypothetical protein B0H14DRAFT_2578826 [Mycena olivaceomarginata]|nr:hypothetical protein B0H14DRAFT_2578826 [Mycena olivaceomarginata]
MDMPETGGGPEESRMRKFLVTSGRLRVACPPVMDYTAFSDNTWFSGSVEWMLYHSRFCFVRMFRTKQYQRQISASAGGRVPNGAGERAANGAGTERGGRAVNSPQMNKDYLFLGPARFHDCDNNCELSREGKHITFRVLRSIAIGKEITVHYGDGYFGRENRHCLCTSCEKAGRGGYAPNYAKGDPPMNSESDLDSEPCEPKFDDEQETLV